MECQAIQKRISAYLDGELEAGLRETIQAHLNECAECRQAAAQLSKVYALLEHDVAQPANPFLWTRVQARLSSPRSVRRSRRLQRLLTPVTVALALFVGIALGVSIGEHALSSTAVSSDATVESSLWSDANSLALQYADAFGTDNSENGGRHE